jgi:hypothetical protein
LRREGTGIFDPRKYTVRSIWHWTTSLMSKYSDICVWVELSCQTQVSLAYTAQTDDENAVN